MHVYYNYCIGHRISPNPGKYCFGGASVELQAPKGPIVIQMARYYGYNVECQWPPLLLWHVLIASSCQWPRY